MDIRELRIGNHVLYDGERMEVKAIDSEEEEICGLVGDRWTMADEEDIAPIPITENLLKELGFEVRVLTYRLKAEIEIDEFLISLNKMKNADFFELYIYNQALRESQNMLVRELHTLQNFVYLTTKQELI